VVVKRIEINAQNALAVIGINIDICDAWNGLKFGSNSLLGELAEAHAGVGVVRQSL
jgi:hypothetical protein